MSSIGPPARVLAIVAACWLAPLQLTAQDSTRSTTNLCYRGRPAPSCKRFVLTELGYYARAAGTSTTTSSTYGDGLPGSYSFTERDMTNQLTWEVGMMANRGPRTALGATLLLGLGNGGGNGGIKGRYRRWLGDDGLALDLGAGVISGTVARDDWSDGGLGLTGDVALNAADYGSVVLRVDVARYQERTASAVYGGVRLGSKPALAGTALLALGLVLLIASFRTGY